MCLVKRTSQRVQRNFGVSNAVVLFGRQLPCPNIDLYRRQCQHRYLQSGIALGAHVYKSGLTDAVVYMDVFGLLLGHCLLKGYGSVGWWIVMAHEQPGRRRQAEYFCHRSVQGFGVTPRKVAASGADIGHDHGVTHEHSIAKLLSHASGRGSPACPQFLNCCF